MLEKNKYLGIQTDIPIWHGGTSNSAQKAGKR
jgi:hypothetical protein